MSKESKALFRRYLNDDMSADELHRFHELVKAGKIDPEELEEVMEEVMDQPGFIMEGGSLEKQKAWETILSEIGVEKRTANTVKLNRRWVAVAAATVGILVGGYLIKQAYHSPVSGKAGMVAKESHDVAPGRNGAVLTLADGSQVSLDSAGNGMVNKQGNTIILKQEGQLTYSQGSGSDQTLSYNTLSTPRGRQFMVKLSDGTQVWLNAASSIRYPIAFGRSERVVEVTGEAYFEVRQDPGRPFKVKVGQMDVDVLGTHFDVDSYGDQQVLKATLLEGRIKVTDPHSSKLLQPGQQAQLGRTGGISVVNDVDPGDVVAWKDGVFQFDESDIHTVMSQLARWYDIDVRYEGTINTHFGGAISRSVDLSKVLEMLQKTGAVSFEINGKTVIVRG